MPKMGEGVCVIRHTVGNFGNPEAPAIPDDGADDDDGYTPSTTVIEDQEVPLAGLLPVAQLLEEPDPA